jgi:3',5'-cyclic AMP phosphodiesterase CpdA
VPSTILHVSDLHFGARNGLDDPGLERAIGDLVARVAPDLVVASGDLTHRGRQAEHEAAARYLRALGPPLLVVPGNHDIPTFPPERLSRPFAEFERCWGTVAPAYSGPGLEVVGICSVSPWGYQRGHIGPSALSGVEERLAAAPSGSLRVVALHHQLLGAPWRNTKLPLRSRTHALTRLAGAGADLVLSGHIHQAAIAERREFEVVTGRTGACVLATAPGLGRPRPSRPFEARGVLVHRADERELRVEAHVWRDEAWALTGTRTFPRGEKP